MTQIVDPSPDRTGKARRVAEAVRRSALSPGWIADTNTEYIAADEGLTGTPLNAFKASTSTSSFDVTFDTGEAFINGSWLAKDTTTTVTLASSTTGQDVYLGWSATSADTVIIGKSGAFNAYDPKVHIYTFDTDGSGVTASTDYRPIGERLDQPNAKYDADLSGVVDDAENAQALGGQSSTVTFRDVATISMGVAKLEDTEKYRQLERVPSNTTWKLLSVTMMNAAFDAESGAYIKVFDSAGNQIYSQNGQKYKTGSVSNPIASHAGADDIEIWLENQVGSTRRYSARLTYILDPS